MKFKKFITPFLVIGFAGVLLHFLYEWTNENPVIGIFSAVNESIWEHLKLLFFPALVYSMIIQILTKGKISTNLLASLIGILSGMAFTIVVYYTYTGILGYQISWLNIAIHFLSVAVFLTVRNVACKNLKTVKPATNLLAIVILLSFCVLFAIWTFIPPQIALFIPPEM